MQNILIINGSPRKNGNISKMLEAIKKEAEKQGANVSAIHVHDLQIKPCNGCMNCRKNLTCVLPEDGTQATLQLINKCDVLVVGSPCYWGNLPGELKILFDRIVYGMMGESPKGIPQPLHKGKKSHHRKHLYYPLPVQYTFQPNKRNRQSTKGNSQMERIQNRLYHRERRNEKIPLAGKRFPALSKNRPQSSEIITTQTN